LAIRGFIHLAGVYSQANLRLSGLSGGGTVGHANTVMYNLADWLNTYTGIRADFIEQITFDDERLMEVPFVIFMGGILSEEELRCLTDYLLRGGFVFGITDLTEGLEKYGGLVKGVDFYTARLPENHPIFSIFFDVRGGVPPTTALGHVARPEIAWSSMDGLWVKGRLAGADYGIGGGANYWGRAEHLGADATRSRQLGVNIIVYALTQEGSITHQLMQMVK
jgi:hypothetical protein